MPPSQPSLPAQPSLPSSLSRRAFLATGALGAAALGAPAVLTACRTTSARAVTRLVDGAPHVDGAGVKLRKLLGGRALPMLDPFLMLDEFKSDDERDVIAGFPSHPHRGFETVTLMIDGAVAHEDSVGNRGLIEGGGAQWMTAGRGIVHAEMPRTSTTSGVCWGYQLWVNLPAKLKMQTPRYQELAAADFPMLQADDATARVLVGAHGGRRGPLDRIATDPLVLDATIPAGGRLRARLPAAHASFVQLVDGSATIGGTALTNRVLAVLGPGDELEVRSALGARLFAFAAAPIGEPVARRGPFVMNTDEEIRQAYDDYRSGRLVGG